MSELFTINVVVNCRTKGISKYIYIFNLLIYSIICFPTHSEDTPTANCGTSGANDYIEIVNSRASSAGDP